VWRKELAHDYCTTPEQTVADRELHITDPGQAVKCDTNYYLNYSQIHSKRNIKKNYVITYLRYKN